jgi:hypothetical protein
LEEKSKEQIVHPIFGGWIDDDDEGGKTKKTQGFYV